MEFSKGSCAILVLTLGSSGSAFAAEPTQEEPVARKRSVLFYLIDTCRADRMSFNDYDRPTTPFLEELAERSVVFENCFSQAPWTKPSMASMLCSQYPSTTGVHQLMQQLPSEAFTWPEHLQEQGYFTAGFSTNIVMSSMLSNFAQGFDHFVESLAINQGDPIRYASGSARKLNAHVFPWLDETDHWPMLLYLHSVDPHEEYAPEEEYLWEFADAELDPQYREDWDLLQKNRPIPGLHVTQEDFDRAKVDRATFIEHGSNLYDADLLANDDQLALLWKKIEEDGWGEDHVFILTSDHGEEFFEHGATSHGYSLYNEMIRVPLMIYAPGLLPEGLRVEHNVRLLDIYPTLCDLLELEVPAHVQGESLLPLIRDPEAWEEASVIAEHREDPGARLIGQGSGVMVSLQQGPWKMVRNQVAPQQKERPRVELYNIDEDPGEQWNVAEENPEVVGEFELQIEAFVTEHGNGQPVEELASPDSEVLDQLRQLGYLAEENDEEEGKQLLQDLLWAAVASGDFEATREHLAAGADPRRKDPMNGMTLLAQASILGHTDVARLLLEGGVDVNARNADGASSLHAAAFLGHPETVRLLLEMGADRQALTLNGDTPLQAAQAPWDITVFIANLLQIELDREKVMAGRREVVELLRAERDKDAGSSP